MSSEVQIPKLNLRCYGYRSRQGHWVAACIDLDLGVERPTQDEALKALHEQIFSYIQAVLDTNDPESISYLLPRRSPWWEHLRYHAIALICWFNRFKKFPVFKETFPLPHPALS